MILQLSRQTVRHTWPAYLGAFVALTFGVLLLGTTVGVVAAVAVATAAPGVTRAERMQLDDLSSLFGVMSAISLFMALFVVGSTFGFVVATRRRELGLLRLTGATPRQVRLMVLLESALVAAAATVVGCLLTTVLLPGALWAIRVQGVTDLHLAAPAAWLPWAIAGPCGAAVALLGGWRSSRRASRVPPVAALREAVVDRRRPTVLGLLVAVTSLGCVVVVAALAGIMPPLFAMIVAVLLPEVVVVGVMCIGTVVLPRVAALVARPFVGVDVAARLGRDQLTAAARTTASLAAPVMAISAIAGSLVLTLAFTADWTSAQDRARLVAPLVVETGGEAAAAAAVDADPTTGTVDARRRVLLPSADGPTEVDLVDPAAAAAARGLRAVEGDLARLHGRAIAVSRAWTTDTGRGIGDTLRARVAGERVRLEVVAVLADAPGLYGEVVAAGDLLGEAPPDVVPDELFVVPADGTTPAAARVALERALGDVAGSRVLSDEAWLARNDEATRRANDLGLWVLLGPGGLYAAIAMVNATLIGASQRRRQDAVVRLLGATPAQVRRTATWEAAFIGAAGLVVGALTTCLVGWVVRSAIDRDVPGAGMTVPWLPLAGIAGTCLVLVVTAAVAGARVHTVAGRRAPA